MAYELDLDKIAKDVEEKARWKSATLSQMLRAGVDAGGDALRGVFTGMVGAPGDVEDLARNDIPLAPGVRIKNPLAKGARYLPTSEEVSSYLPKLPHGSLMDEETSKYFEGAGGMFSPTELAKLPGATKAVVEGLRAPVPRTMSKGVAGGQKGALYPGAFRQDLLMSHNTAVDKLFNKDGTLKNEAYNLSLGITKNKPMSFDQGDVLLVPHEGAFDPKTSPTVITSFDTYSPRSRETGGMGGDKAKNTLQLVEMLRKNPDLIYEHGVADEFGKATEDVRNLARQRMIDRFVSRFPKGGILQEGAGARAIPNLPHFKLGGYTSEYPHLYKQEYKNGVLDLSYMNDPVAEVGQTLSYGKRFRDFKDYEKHPFGAARLDSGVRSSQAYEDINDFLYHKQKEIKNFIGKQVPVGESVQSSERATQILRELASMETNKWSSVGKLGIKNRAQELIRQLRTTKSAYGEAKVYGPVGIHRDNFAGIIADSAMPNDKYQKLEAEAMRRGLAIESAPLNTGRAENQEEAFEMAKWLQNYAKEGKKAPISFSGSRPKPNIEDLLQQLPGAEKKVSLEETKAKVAANILKFSGGTKSKISEFSEDELMNFLDKGLDLGLDINHWHSLPQISKL